MGTIINGLFGGSGSLVKNTQISNALMGLYSTNFHFLASTRSPYIFCDKLMFVSEKPLDISLISSSFWDYEHVFLSKQ